MVSHLEPSEPSYPSFQMTRHTYRRAVMNRIDGLRNESEQEHRQIQKKIQDIRIQLSEQLQELAGQVKESHQGLTHLTGRVRYELKHLPIIPVPVSWGMPRYQFGQRVLIVPYNLAGIVSGIQYSDGTVHDAGWHYIVKLDYVPCPRDEIESVIESDLQPLGLIDNSSLSIVSESD